MRAITHSSIAILVLVLAGCAGQGEPGEAPVETRERAEPVLTQPVLPPTAPEVLEYCPTEEAIHFGGDTDPIEEVYTCSVVLPPDAPEGTRIERVERVIDWQDQLLANYSEPNEFATTGACIEIAPDPLILWLHEADGITPIYAPVDECGFPNDVATEAYELAEKQTVLEVEVESEIGENNDTEKMPEEN